MTAPTPPEAPQKAKPLWLRLLPVLILAAALIAVLASGVWRDLNLETLQENRAALETYVAANLILAVLI